VSEVPLYTTAVLEDKDTPVQGHLAHKKTPPPQDLQQADAQGPMGVLGGWAFSYGRGIPVSIP
jgi:hypothetical protein